MAVGTVDARGTPTNLFITSSARCSAAAIALLSCISLSILHRRNAIEFLDKVLDPWRLSSKSLGLWPLPLLGPSEDAVLGSDQCSQPRMVVFESLRLGTPASTGVLITISCERLASWQCDHVHLDVALEPCQFYIYWPPSHRHPVHAVSFWQAYSSNLASETSG
ncbi:hypothetical protein SCLCIDRAFT_924510 [Scleroderma citrinum Foug A]|uniref:Uncharacterized protein n=1 Tax=Scleroderma citrinum Foug A TaxID=1036808 RepID=A0A0C3DXK2_9AGAM|nr:hypothetical protein SCLCIDRAFT_924510 [Scleroderma citrinum Foug A]